MPRSPWFTRRNLPDSVRDLTSWPEVDIGALETEIADHVARRQRAIRAYLQGHAMRFIRKDCGISTTELLRCLNRCVTRNPDDGRLYGWRALLPWQHTRQYVRLAAPRQGSRGNVGAFSQFLRDHPEIATPLDAVILKTKVHDALRESRYSHKETYGHFRRLCLQAGISETQYPRNASDGGRRAVRRYALDVLRAHFSKHAARTGGRDAAVRARIGRGVGEPFSAEAPFDLVSIDAHRLNFIGCIGIPTPARVEIVPIRRFQLLPVIEHHSTAALGYTVAITREANAQHAVKAVKHALTPWTQRALSLPGHEYPRGAMMPSAALPETQGLCWNALLIDNASINCSTAIAEDLRKRLGCALNFGGVRQWYRRPLIESLFSALERAGFLRLPNTTGTGPADPLRPDAVANAVKYQMLFEQMLDLIDIVICSYNAHVPETGGPSPLERLSEAVLAAPVLWLPRTLPVLPAHVPELGVEVLTMTVVGNRKKGRRPYVQYLGVRYSSPVLSHAYDLIHQEIRVHVQHEDLRTFKAFLPSGEELGILNATGGWDRTRHDRALRKEILRAINDRSLVCNPGDDPIQSYLVLKAQEALARQKRRGRRITVSPEASALARAVHVSEQPVPEVDSPPIPPSMTPQPLDPSPIPLPSFVPRIRHRGHHK